jgi:hypothetical protein
MSIFGNIMSSIFGGPAAAAASSASGSQSAAGIQSVMPVTAMAQAPASAMQQIDVAAVMDKLAEQSDEDLDWRKSIVDLMKLLNLDSSLNARKQLAQELQFAGNTKDSATMNIWLHKQVMLKLAENGGKIPAELKH